MSEPVAEQQITNAAGETPRVASARPDSKASQRAASAAQQRPASSASQKPPSRVPSARHDAEPLALGEAHNHEATGKQ